MENKKIKQLYFDRATGNYYEIIPYGQKAAEPQQTIPNPQNTVPVYYQQEQSYLQSANVAVPPTDWLINKMNPVTNTQENNLPTYDELYNFYRQSIINSKTYPNKEMVETPTYDQQQMNYFRRNIENSNQPPTQTGADILGEILAPPYSEEG